MDKIKTKKDYAVIQIKLYNKISALDKLLDNYIKDSQTVSYKRISSLYKNINRLLVHSEKLKQDIIYFELIG